MSLSFLRVVAVVQSTPYRLVGPILEVGAIAPTLPAWRRRRDQWQSGRAFIFLLHPGAFTAPASTMLRLRPGAMPVQLSGRAFA